MGGERLGALPGGRRLGAYSLLVPLAGRLYPAGEVRQGDVGEHPHVVRAVVERGDVPVGLAAGMEEELAVLTVDLLDGFQAVGGKTRADDVQAPDPGTGHGLDGLLAV